MSTNTNGTGVPQSRPTGSVFNDKNQKWQIELMMERLRSKKSQYKNFQEMSKTMRMALLEKRYQLDHVEKANLQKCLDSMQEHCIKVTTRQGLVERLESLTRQLGLKFMEDTSGLFISSDMFYLEIVLDPNGIVQDVKVHHECKNEQQSCSELVECLVKGDFVDFTTQLEGLASIYQLNAESKIKSKAFIALQALESDLLNLFVIQNFNKDPYLILLQSDVGILQKRRGGHPMRLTFLVSPFELLDLEKQSISPLSIELINTKTIGFSATINLEASGANKLQILPILSINKDQQAIYCPLATHNSTMLPASFVLRLNKPMPLTTSWIQQIQQITELPFGDSSKNSPFLGLISNHESEGVYKCGTKGVFVSLPDQTHCYFLTESSNLNGIIIKSVPFTEPKHVPLILKILRQQAMFNTLIASCIRIESKQDIENAVIFEICAISCQHITISLEHPIEESMATVEFDLQDLSNITCKIFCLTKNYDAIALKLSKIIQKCLSIPITLRALIKSWQITDTNISIQQQPPQNGNFNLPLGPSDPGGSDFRDAKIKTERINGFNNGNGTTGGGGVSGSSTSNSINKNYENSENILLNQLDPLGSFDAKPVKKRRTTIAEDFWKSPKSNKMDEGSNNSSDSYSLGTQSLISEHGVVASTQLTQNSSDIFLLDNNSQQSDGSDFDDIGYKRKSQNHKKLIDLSDSANKNLIPPSVSITPINSSNFNSVLSGITMGRRPGIEIIPISSASTQNLPSSITITPINSTSGSSSSKTDKKSSSSGTSSKQQQRDDKSRWDKKKKRKRDDSPMGPPSTKIPSLKQDGLTKPVSVSIKTTDGSPISPTGLLKKFSPSPVPKLNSGSNPGTSKPSPRNSPIYHGSPKNQSPKHGLSSPKHPSTSGSGKPSMSALKSAANSPSSKNDKIQSSSSSSKSSSKDKERSGDREKKLSSPKLKQSSVKLKPLEIPITSPNDLMSSSGDSPNSGIFDLTKSSSNNQLARNRKSSLSAVIDKLKSAQHTVVDDIPQSPGSSGGGSSQQQPIKSNSSSSQPIKERQISSGSSKMNSISSSKNSEYMVKPSLDGMKITINKTRTKDSSVSSSNKSNNSSSSGLSTKLNSNFNLSSKTGLKPGVNSGPASKKPQQFGTSSKSPNKPSLQKSSSFGQLTPAKSSSNVFTSSSKSNSPKGTYDNSSSSNSSSSSSSSSTKREKIISSKLPKVSSSGGGGGVGVSSSSSTTSSINDRHFRTDPSDVMKFLGFPSTPLAREGFKKSLDTKFQIPKLSRTSQDDNKKEIIKSSTTTSTLLTNQITPINSTTARNDVKMLADLLVSKESKYSFSSINSNPIGISLLNKIPLNSPSDFTIQKSNSSESLSYTNSIGGNFSSSSTNELIDRTPSISPRLQQQSTEPSRLMRPPSAPPIQTIKNIQSIDEFALDYSSATTKQQDVVMKITSSSSASSLIQQSIRKSVDMVMQQSQIPTVKNPTFPASPSVSVHIVKSPVPSPLMIIPSPHSNSSIDDELMDEALVGISGK